MTKRICKFLLFKCMGWQAQVDVPFYDKCILCVAPHTSNMDFLIGKLYYGALGRNARFLMKKEWFFFPLGLLLKHIGGIPVYRDANHSLTDQLAEWAQRETSFELAITPEGTRSARSEWKKGFYFVAQKANIPVMLYGLDYKQKRIVCTKVLDVSTMTAEEAVAEAKAYFSGFTGKHPEKFAT